MNRARPFINRLVKRKQQQIEDSYHSTNLKDIKPMTSKLMEHGETIIINHGKRQMIKQVRQIQIERQNKLLLQKIASVMGKKGAYSVAKTKNIRTKANKSLNEIYRKRQHQNIQLQNRKFLQRLQNKRPTLNLQKLNKQWVQNKSTIKRMANIDFYLTNIKSASRMKSITSQRLYKSKYDKMKLIRQKVVDGEKMLIKIEFIGDMLKIVGDSQGSKDIKIIEIPKEQAVALIQKDCQGKIELLLQKLKYDAQTGTLYLVSESLSDDENINFNLNPEIDKFLVNKQSDKKKSVDNERKNKSMVQHVNKSIKQVSNQTIDPQFQKSKTINVVSQANSVQKKVQPIQLQYPNDDKFQQFQYSGEIANTSNNNKEKSEKKIEKIEQKHEKPISKSQQCQKIDQKAVENQKAIKQNTKNEIKQQQKRNQQAQEEHYDEQDFNQQLKVQKHLGIESPKNEQTHPKLIVAEAEDYNQQFQASAQVKKIQEIEEIDNNEL